MLQIGWIGVGNMGEAILRGALQGSALTAEQVHLFDANILKTNKLQEELHVHVAGSAAELISVSDMVLLAVKPHVCSVVLAEHREMLQDKALISIAAGWSQERLAALLPERVRILRVMPNTPAMVGEGMTVFVQGNTLSREEYEFALQLFSAVGRVSEAESQQMDAVTGVSGSGPAYVYVFIEALADAGVRAGLPRRNGRASRQIEGQCLCARRNNDRGGCGIGALRISQRHFGSSGCLRNKIQVDREINNIIYFL